MPDNKTLIDIKKATPAKKAPVGIPDVKDLVLGIKKMSRDNTKVIPANISPTWKEKEAYYNPPVKDVSSGDKATDFLYKNKWLMKVPVVGDLIKDKAYQIAKNSSGMETLDAKQLEQAKNGIPATDKNYDGTEKKGWTYTGQDLTKEKKNPINLLDQYFSKTSLPKSIYKPTSDYLQFLPSVSIKGDFEKTPGLETYQYAPDGTGLTKVSLKTKNLTPWIDYIKSGAASFGGKSMKDLDYNKAPIYSQEGNDSPVSMALGTNLNGHKLGISFDKERNLPYISISDAWDFSPKDYQLKNGLLNTGDKKIGDRAYVQASLMHAAGKPFKVYDRFYFDPKTNEYVPDNKVPVIKQKDLPKFPLAPPQE